MRGILLACISATCAVLGVGSVSAGPVPMPLICRLDLADRVVVGKITAIADDAEKSGDHVMVSTATLTIQRVVKGEAPEALKVRVATWVGPAYGGSSPPHVRKIGDEGIWIINPPWSSYPELLPASRLDAVEKALAELKDRKWSKEVNGLTAWATAVNYEFDGRPVIVFAIRNVTQAPIFYPAVHQPGFLEISAMDDAGKVYAREDATPGKGKDVSFNDVKPGQMVYVHPAASFISVERELPPLPPGKYRVTVALQNGVDGEAAVIPEWRKVEGWKGKLAAEPFELTIPKKESSPEPAREPLTEAKAVDIARAFLDKQAWMARYDGSKPSRVQQTADGWDVYFRTKLSQDPGEGLIRVNKTTGEAVWILLR